MEAHEIWLSTIGLSVIGAFIGRYARNRYIGESTASYIFVATVFLAGFWGFVFGLGITILTDWPLEPHLKLMVSFFSCGMIGGAFIHDTWYTFGK